MKCPYCGSEMKEGDDSSTTWERFRGKGELQCVYYSRIPRRFNIGAVYCERCRLMMFKTDIWDKA